MTLQRVLVVDTEAPIRETISAILKAGGYTAQQASSGAEALSILQQTGEFELVLSNPLMPNPDGMALIERFEQMYPDMPVILILSGPEVAVALAATRNGAYGYLIKPYERAQVLAMVERALQHRRLKVENRAHHANLQTQVAERIEQLKKDMIDLERSYDLCLELACDMLDLKDTVSAGHAKRVTAFTIAIARALNLPGPTIRVIARGTFLHDIGMIAVPDAILHKPGPLTAEETAIVREHCVRGYQVLRKIPFFAEAAEIVYTHEERFDGSGFPRGLKGEHIPLGARIFCVAHAIDAITTPRPYRAARSAAEARQEIAQLAGQQFDPDIVRVALALSDTVWEDLRAEVDLQIGLLKRHAASG